MVIQSLQTLLVSTLGMQRGEVFQVPDDTQLLDAYGHSSGGVAVAYMGSPNRPLTPLEVRVLTSGESVADTERLTHLASFEQPYRQLPMHVFYRFLEVRPIV